MAENIGYVNIDETNEFIKNNFFSKSKEKTGWDALSDEDKNVVLRMSLRDIDLNDFLGKKTSPEQITEFPRDITANAVPTDVKLAQMYEAAAIAANIADFSPSNFSQKDVAAAMSGISGESIGDASISRDLDIFLKYYFNTFSGEAVLRSNVANKLINKYIIKCYDII